MRYGSVCSGIEAASAAWHSLGWQAQWFSEIEKFPSAVLAEKYPDVPNYGDMTKFKEWPDEPIDLLVGGTPCQSFSVAGLRKGLDDPRGNLALTYLAIAARYSPKWLVWENVPGVLSSNRGRDFGSFLGAMAQLGYGFAYRVLDAQYFGVAQRRRRVFVVGHLGDWRGAAAVLFERESLSGHPSPREQAGQEVAKCLTTRVGSANDALTETFVTEQEKVNAITASYGTGGPDYETKPLVFGAQNSSTQSLSASTEVSPTLDKSKTPAVAYVDSENNAVDPSEPLGPLMAGSPSGGGRPLPAVVHTLQTKCGEVTEDGTGRGSPLWPERNVVRRLTPRECERLQGFPDDYTLIQYRNKPAADGPRYKALGNSMAVPVMRWIGERIDMVEQINGR